MPRGFGKKKGEAGEAVRFISRSRAIRKLQLSIHGFNRLCIIKGIYPIEPKNRIRAQKGDSKYRPLYLKKDIKFLLHDPLMWTIRTENALWKKIASARHKKDFAKQKLLKRNKPTYSLSQNVLERYPTFADAVKDLADPLTMIFLFSAIPARAPIMEHHVSRCQRLRWEFLTYVIEAQCLTKAFIATKGYYYEVEILGKKIVWLVPHNCVQEVPPNADMKIMRHFLEFYIAMLGFVNFRLLGKVNLRYPLKPAVMPNFDKTAKKDLDNFKNLMASLNYPLERTAEKKVTEEENTAEDMDSHLLALSTNASRQAYMETLQASERRKLFKGLKFFISRENNRESLTLIIRNCGGEVSWPADVFPCSKYHEDDESITHQIVDRPGFEKKYLSRYYIQPQWVYDSLNTATLQPCQPYFPGAELPPHICPFLRNTDGWYVPPEEELFRKLLDCTPAEKEQILKKLSEEEKEKAAKLLAEEQEAESSADEEDEEEEDEEEESKEEEMDPKEQNSSEDKDDDSGHNSEADETKDSEEEEEMEQEEKVEEKVAPPKREVRRGREIHIDEKVENEKEEGNEYKMRAFMIHPKNKRLYNKMKMTEARYDRRQNVLKLKREAIEAKKAGKLTQTDLDKWRPPAQKQTIGEKKKRAYREKVGSAVAFAKSKRNVNRDKGAKK